MRERDPDRKGKPRPRREPVGQTPIPKPDGGGSGGLAREEDEEHTSTPVTRGGGEPSAVTLFDQQLEVAITECFPVFLGRLKHVYFADWHRRQGLEADLAHSALVAVASHCRRSRHIPDDLLAYLVQTAKHLAMAAWKERRRGPVLFADLQRVPARPGVTERDVGAVITVADGADCDVGDSGRDGLDRQQVNEHPDENLAGEPASDTELDAAPENYITSTVEQIPRVISESIQLGIDSLPRRQREALQLYLKFKDERTNADMAKMMNISKEGFEKNLERARKTLRQLLTNKGA